MIRLFVLVALLAGARLSAVEPAPDSLFAYDRQVPLELTEASREIRDNAVIRDVTFVGVNAPVKAYLVVPARGGESLAAILYVHWLGDPKTTNRSEFLNEAVALAGQGVVSLLVDTMWATPQWYETRVPEQDYDHAIRQVIELRRAMDLLLAQPGVDADRVGFVGHDFGAMYGLIAEALDRRARTCVLMAPTPRFVDWFLFSRQPKDLPAYREQLAPLAPVNYIGKLAPAPVFFQFAAHDEYVSHATAAELYDAAGPLKQMATYDAGHDLQKADVQGDRLAWLMRHLAPR